MLSELEKRLADKIAVNDAGCWEWTGRTHLGYTDENGVEREILECRHWIYPPRPYHGPVRPTARRRCEFCGGLR